VFYLILRGLVCDKLDNEERSHRKDYSEGQTDKDILNESRNNEHYEGYCRNGYRVGYLRGYVIEVVALTARGRHDSRIRNG
jgi:hypothetical protein